MCYASNTGLGTKGNTVKRNFIIFLIALWGTLYIGVKSIGLNPALWLQAEQPWADYIVLSLITNEDNNAYLHKAVEVIT